MVVPLVLGSLKQSVLCQGPKISVNKTVGHRSPWPTYLVRMVSGGADRGCVCVGGEGSSSPSSFFPSIFSCVSDACCVLSCPLQIVLSEGALATRDIKLTRSFLGMASSLAGTCTGGLALGRRGRVLLLQYVVAQPSCSPLPVGAEASVSQVSHPEKKKKDILLWLGPRSLHVCVENRHASFACITLLLPSPTLHLLSQARAPFLDIGTWEAEHLQIKNLPISFIDWKKECFRPALAHGVTGGDYSSGDGLWGHHSFSFLSCRLFIQMTVQATRVDQPFWLELGWRMGMFSL